MGFVRYFSHEFVEKSELSCSEASKVSHFRDNYDDQSRLARHEKVDFSGKVLSRSDFRYSKNFLSSVDFDGDGKLIGRSYSLMDETGSWYAQSKTILDDKGNVIYPVRYQKQPNRLGIMGARNIHPDSDFNQVFLGLKGQEMQLNLPKKNELLYIDNAHLRKSIEDMGISMSIMHGPDLDVFHQEFCETLGWIRGNYGIDTLTLHPLRGDFENAMERFGQNKEELEGLGMKLSYENLCATDRWLKHPEEIMDVPYNFIGSTIDISHLNPNTDLMSLEEKVFEKLDVVHLSNINGGQKHSPYREGIFPVKNFLCALKSDGYRGKIILEYAPQFRDRLGDDIIRLREFFGV